MCHVLRQRNIRRRDLADVLEEGAESDGVLLRVTHQHHQCFGGLGNRRPMVFSEEELVNVGDVGHRLTEKPLVPLL